MGRKILVVSQRFWPETNQINDICEGFAEKGCDIDVLCGKPYFPRGEFYEGYSSIKPSKEEHGRLTIYRAMDVKKNNTSSLTRFFNYTVFPIASLIRKRALRKNQYDAVLIYQQSPVMMSWAGLKTGVKKRIPVTMMVEDVWPEKLYDEMEVNSYLFNRFLTRISRKCYQRATRLIVNSENTGRYLAREMEIAQSRIHFVPQFPYRTMDREKVDENLLDRYAGSFNIMFIGDVTSEYSFDTVIEAAKRIDSHAVRDIRFIIAGSGLALPELKKQVDKLNLNDYFFFDEDVTAADMPRYAYVADALFACTKMDKANSFSQPVLAANYLAAGRPLLLAMGSEFRKLIREASCGYASEPDDADGFYDNIMKLYKTPREKLREMGHNAKLYQREHFGREACIDEIYDIVFDEGH